MGLYSWLILAPLRKLFLFGPNLGHVGFWNGVSQSEICQSITSYSETFWTTHADECSQLVESRFQAFRSTTEVCLYFFCMWKLAGVLSRLSLWAVIRKLDVGPLRQPNDPHRLQF